MTNDELQQFKKLLAENNQQLEQNFQKRLEGNNKQIRKEIKAEVDPLHERLDTQYKNLSSQINGVKTELNETIRQEASVIADLIIDHDEQIAELQKAVGLRPKH